jgi:transcriptional regulator with XRE-family HTH domain
MGGDWRRTFRTRLQELLEERHMTQKQLAEEIYVSRAAVSSYMSGARVPSVPTLINIAHALGCRISDLVY